ncbi:MAG: SirA family protein [Legionellales bacterium]|nr:SirA family protein [Legionellales bacterium]|tara:strand:- start:938 stop:1168 length:231 start_codon:yes stop_codon:yes gene_type:complete
MSLHELDARRLICPMPVIRTQDKIKALAPADILIVYCTDPGVKQDIPAWCEINGHEVLSIEYEARDIIVTIKVGHT